MSINNDTIIEFLEIFKKKSLYCDFIKVFLYNNSIPVIEIKYKNRRFAFDVTCDKNDICRIKLCWRKEAAQYSTLIKFDKKVQFNLIGDILTGKIKELIKFIDDYGSIKCSVVVPMYNRENLISPLINSLNKQTLDKELFEVIFVDDASSDDTVEVVCKQATDFNFRIIRRLTPSGNASAPRNEGIRAAYGDYILFIDSDDYMAEYTLKDALEYAEKNTSDMIFLKLAGVNGRQVSARTFVGKNVPKASVFKHFLFNSFYPTKFLRTSVLRNNSILFDQSFTKEEDKLFIVSAVCFSNVISILREKDYIFLVSHDGEHLSKKSESNELFRVSRLWSYCISIINTNSDIMKKKYMYNALLYRFIRAYYDVLISDKCNKYFINVLDMFIKYKELFNIEYIYKDGRGKILNVFKKFNINIIEKYSKMATIFRNNGDIKIGNRIILIHLNGTREEIKEFPKLEIVFTGECGLVEIHETVQINEKLKVVIGEQSFLHLDEQVYIENAYLNLDAFSSTMIIGKNTSIQSFNCNCSHGKYIEVIIGEYTTISCNVMFYPVDNYNIIDIDNNIINMSNFGIHIDDHVYIGNSVNILKDVYIPRGCVIKDCSVVNNDEFLKNSIISGIPARVIKSRIVWNKEESYE